MAKAICPSCGAPGVAGKECEYCGTLIPFRTRKLSTEEREYEDPYEFWEGVCPDNFSPEILTLTQEEADDGGVYRTYMIVVDHNDKGYQGIINRQGQFVKGPEHIKYDWLFDDNCDYIWHNLFENSRLTIFATGEEFEIEGYIDWQLSKILDDNFRFLAIKDNLWTAIIDRHHKKLMTFSKPVYIDGYKLLDKGNTDNEEKFVFGGTLKDNLTIIVENDEAIVAYESFWEEVCPVNFVPYYIVENVDVSELRDVSKQSYMMVVNCDDVKSHGVINREGQFVKGPENVTYAKLFPDNYDYIFRNGKGYRLVSLATGEEFKLGITIARDLCKVIDANYRYIPIKEQSRLTAIFDRHKKKRIKLYDPVHVAYKLSDVVNNNNVLQLVFSRAPKDKMTVTIKDGKTTITREGSKKPSYSARFKEEWGISIVSVVAFVFYVLFMIYGVYRCSNI